MLQSLLEKFEDSTFGAYAIPVIYACVGALLMLVVTGVTSHFLRRRVDVAESSQQHSTFARMLRNDGQFLLRLIKWIRWVSVALIIAMAISMLIESLSELFLQSNKLKSGALSLQKANVKLESGVRAVGRAFWSFVFIFFVGRVIENSMHAVISRYVTQQNEWRSQARVQTLNLMSTYFVRTVMGVVMTLTILQTFGFNIAPLLATAGVASIAIGFGAQSLVKDVLAGFFILLEDQFAVGDIISIDDKTGKVESMTLRITRLRAGDGQMIVIPNSEIKTVRNATTGWVQFELLFGIHYAANTDKALAILTEEMTKLHSEKSGSMMPLPEIAGVAKLADSSVVLKAFVRTVPEKKWEIERELNRRILSRFKAEKIEMGNARMDINGLQKRDVPAN